jgi:ZIP family zinc transporter
MGFAQRIRFTDWRCHRLVCGYAPGSCCLDMAFGSGVLISALSFELMDEAWNEGGFLAVGVGFIAGASVYTGLSMALAARGARHRKRSDALARKERTAVAPECNSASLALGALTSSGWSNRLGRGLRVFLSNLPEGLSSAVGARREGKTATYAFTLWAAIAVSAGLSAFAGYTLFDGASPEVLAGIQGVAAGAILAMIIDTMAPEAFEGNYDFAGLIAVAGFLTRARLASRGAQRNNWGMAEIGSSALKKRLDGRREVLAF